MIRSTTHQKTGSDECSIQLKCELLKHCYQNEILQELKEKETNLLTTLEKEKEELLDLTKCVTQLANLRKRYEIEKEIENSIEGKIDEGVLKFIENFIGLIKQKRGKVEMPSSVFESEGRIRQLAAETLAQLKTFQKNEKNLLDEIIQFNKNIPQLDECLNKFYVHKRCSELIRLIQRLALHAEALKTIISAPVDT